jgi:predicted extracellular nuclease
MRTALPSSGDQASVVWSLSEEDLPVNQLPWSLPDGTELAVGEVTSRSDDAITISTPGSELTATIGAETAVVATTAETSNMARLIEGISVVIVAERGQDGTLSTERIYISSTAPLPF